MPFTPERWSQIRTIFFAAQEVHPPARVAFVHQASAGDLELEQEVLRLLALDEQAGSFLERPAAVSHSLSDASATALSPSPQLAAGDLLADRFHIVSLIGAGGMGEVYEAQDAVLGDIVALKVVRPGIESIEAMALRLRREAQLARKVTHSSVCRVHDIFVHCLPDDRELLLLTMERLHGETLARRLRREDLSEAQALDIGGQIAAGLDAAHAHGVLHRDVKPDNIFLELREDGTCRAVLTDFGLARTTEMSRVHTAPGVDAEQVTRTGMIAGTPGYMAPEQLRGAGASARSDLYAFAIVVREMLAHATPELSPAHRAVFARALDQDPRHRFPSARDIVMALAAREPRDARETWRVWRRGASWTAALLAVVALVLLVFRLYEHTTPHVAAASQILLTDMVNGTNERELDGATEALRSQLAQSPHFELLERERTDVLLAQMRRAPGAIADPSVAREVAMRAGVPLVVYSALTRLGQDYVLSVKLEQVGARPSLVKTAWTQTFTATGKRSLFEAVRDTAVWIRQMSGEMPSELNAQDRPPADTTTSSWEALRLLARANVLSANGRAQDAVLLLEQAVRIDPEFATAHMRLGDILISLKRDRDGYAAWQRAIALADRRQLTSRESLRIRGQYFEDTGNLPEAEKAYRTYAIHYPNDFHAAFFLASVLVERDRAAEAISWFQKARALHPSSVAACVHLALAQMDVGQTASAMASIASLDSMKARDWADWLRALARFATGDVDRALTMLEPLQASVDDEWRSRASTIRAAWLAERGDEVQAATELRSGIAFDAERNLRDREADKWLHLADLQLRANRRDLYVTSARRALDTASNARRVARVGVLMARAGDLVGARTLLASLSEQPQAMSTDGARLRLLGEISLAQGDARQAVRALEQAVAIAPRREDRVPLARALRRMGAVSRSEQLLAEAVEHPIRIHIGPEPDAPGMWRQAIVERVSLAERRVPAAALHLREKYRLLLRPSPHVGTVNSTSQQPSQESHHER